MSAEPQSDPNRTRPPSPADAAELQVPHSDDPPLERARSGAGGPGATEALPDDARPWGPSDYAGGGLQPRPGDEMIGGGPSGADESPADARAAEQAQHESEDRFAE